MPITVYKSSAGSGKTYTLVRDYICLLIENPFNFKSILAITFTNKATEEMKKRIVSTLSKLHEGKEEGLAKEIAERIRPDVDYSFLPTWEAYHNEIKQNAKKALFLILHNYSEFSVSTIDSFFQKILRSFSKELKLPIAFELNMDVETALNNVVEYLLDSIGQKETKELGDWLELFIKSKLENDKGWKIEDEIKSLGYELFTEHFKELEISRLAPKIAYLRKLADSAGKAKRKFEEELKKRADYIEGRLKANGYSFSDLGRNGKSIWDKYASIDKKNVDSLLASKTVTNLYYEGEVKKWTVAKAPIELQLFAENEIHPFFLETHQFFLEGLDNYFTNSIILKNIYVYGILGKLLYYLREYRDNENLFMISDTNLFLKRVINDDITPFIYEKIGIRYQHILIDEFQDTSSMQWANLMPLVVNSLGEEYKVLIVGDVKQSIYRWRGGNSDLLLSGLKENLEYFFEESSEQQLASNYRSNEAIVAFNNAVFPIAADILQADLNQEDQDNIQKSYATTVQEIKHASGAYVHCKFFTKSGNNKESWQEPAREYLLETVKDLVSKGYQLNDLAILIRNNNDGVDLANFLTSNGYKVISSESLLANNSPNVQLLVYCLKLLNDPLDQIAGSELLYHYYNKNSEKLDQQFPELEFHRLFADRFKEKINFNPESSRQAKSRDAFEKILPEDLMGILETTPTLPLYELAERLITALDLHTATDAYVLRFLDSILSFSTKNSSDLASFLDWWEENKDKKKTSVVIPEGENAIRVLSIHKSKGLEFPVVLIPYGDWDITPKAKSTIWVKPISEELKELVAFPVHPTDVLNKTEFASQFAEEYQKTYLDNLNVGYVAFTRPTQRLYVFSPIPKKPKGNADPAKSLSQLLLKVFLNPAFNFSSNYNSEAMEFSLGDPDFHLDSKAPHGGDSEVETKQLTNFISNDYESKITIRSEAHRMFLLLDNEAGNSIKEGQQIHLILEKLRHQSQLDRTIKSLNAQGLIPKTNIASLKERIEKLFEIEQVKDWFSDEWEVVVERPILTGKMRYIPDRVMLKDNSAIVVDYKTGNQHNKHKTQINNYGSLLEEMGYTVDGKYLLYINESQEIVQVA